MTTYNLTPSQTSVPASASVERNGRVPCVVEAIIDFASTSISGTSGTVIDCINVPAGFAVLSTGLEVLKADSAGNSGTLIVKVDSASQGSAATVAATGFTATIGTMTPVVPAASNVFITLTVGTGTINPVVRVFATLLDQRAKAGTPVYKGTTTNPAGQTSVIAVDQSGYTLTIVV